MLYAVSPVIKFSLVCQSWWRKLIFRFALIPLGVDKGSKNCRAHISKEILEGFEFFVLHESKTVFQKGKKFEIREIIRKFWIKWVSVHNWETGSRKKFIVRTIRILNQFCHFKCLGVAKHFNESLRSGSFLFFLYIFFLKPYPESFDYFWITPNAVGGGVIKSARKTAIFVQFYIW